MRQGITCLSRASRFIDHTALSAKSSSTLAKPVTVFPLTIGSPAVLVAYRRMATPWQSAQVILRISIDEAFADVAGCTHLFGSPAEIARTVRARVRAELGLPTSIGVARTKHLAKIASQVAKPDGLVVVDRETELEFLDELPVALMWGVGPATEARLAKIGVATIGQLAQSSPQSVERLLGHAAGRKLTALAWNRDRRQIQTRRRRTLLAHSRRSDDSP